MIDLFGKEVPEEAPPPARGPFQRWKAQNHYRRSDSGARCCRFCANLVMAGRHYKCRALGDTPSAATDIALRNVCDLWGPCE